MEKFIEITNVMPIDLYGFMLENNVPEGAIFDIDETDMSVRLYWIESDEKSDEKSE